jgi:hypothetical protein
MASARGHSTKPTTVSATSSAVQTDVTREDVDRRRRAHAAAAEVGGVLEEGRVGHRRQHGADLDAGLVQHLLAQRLGEAADGELAGGVGAAVRLRGAAHDGGVLHQRAAALGAELAHGDLGAVVIAEKVGLYHPAPDIRGDGFDAAEDGEARVVEPNVDATEALDGAAPEFLDLVLAGDVGLHDQGRAAERLALARGLFEHPGAPGREDDGRAALGEGVRGGAADAAGSAGDDGDRGFIQRGHRGSPV